MSRTDRRPSRRTLAILAGLLAMPGCMGDGGTLARWRQVHDTSIAKGATKDEIGDSRGLMARWLSPGKVSHEPSAAAKGTGSTARGGSNGWSPPVDEKNPVADAEIKDAQQLFQQGKLAEAETAFAKIAKARKDTSWGEKALYYVAEVQYQRGNYYRANDSFDKLLKTHPNTRYKDKAVEREFAIGQAWLAAEDPKTQAAQKLPWNARFTGRLPLIDPGGFGEQALEHVRHNDPEGPLADDAVMRIADRHYANQDYEMAGVYYDQLITENPKSPLLQKAQLASIDSKMKSYRGPDYDGSGLKQARETVKQTMAIFPERQASTNETLFHTLDLIADQEAQRAFERGAYYRDRHNVTSAEYYFAMINHRWPKSPWAAKAKGELAHLAKLPRKQVVPSRIMTSPGSSDPFSSGSGNPNGMQQGMGGANGMMGP